ncbi:C1 family peptidase [Caenimonas aquaedulcis]|uniref:C1 family peptidase n=1 Tax=Caenimonas aquaedulcis TaxID=2793270 RepID=A0A931H456_9BURK|nr:C1 family peptidase [Caenimonas aquaedulcis]MBG9388281.1 C1 family peptidase [Caenimonas aquaedulcis]
MTQATARRFDARPDRLDLRDLPYRAPLRSLPAVYPPNDEVDRFIASYVAQGLVLDQGNQGACTGFGLACVTNYLFWTRHIQDDVKVPFLPVSPRMLYELAKRYDEWPGVDYEGSSCRGALKGWHKHGVCSQDEWPYVLGKDGTPKFVRPGAKWAEDAARRPLGVYYRIDRNSVVDLQAAIVNIGAIYVSATAHDGWDALAAKRATAAPKKHADLNDIAPITDPRSRGGHAFALVGYNERGFVVQNSWGTKWGASGFAVLPYDDWIVNATDAWACALGVPAFVRATGKASARPMVASRWRVGRGGSLTGLDRSTRQDDNPADDPWPLDHPFAHKPYEPWSTDSAYRHTLVTGNNGELAATDFTRDAGDKEGLAEEIVRIAPQQWMPAQDKVLKVVVYAHGGLNSEDESIKRIRVLGPCFEANGVYPVFMTWKTGVGETLSQIAQDCAARVLGDEAARSKGILDALGDAKDRAVEALAHVLGKGLWTEMRGNAADSVQTGHGLDLLLRNLAALADDLAQKGKTLELHLAGHSAGSILLGHFVSAAAGAQGAAGAPPLRVRTTTLFAAACSSAFANAHYVAAADAGVLNLSSLWLYVLSDANEKSDALPSPSLPAYGKSLLYLVSRALDDVRKMPLLGMERAQRADYEQDDDQWDAGQLAEIQRWRARWPGAKPALLRTVDTPEVITTKANDHIASSHGSFDNNIDAVGETIARIRGARLVAPLEWLDY